MAPLKIYGIPRSRTFRALWMAEELGIGYELVPVDFKTGDVRTESFLKINPNGHIPAIDDDGLVLWESMAINLYLARKYGGALAPANAAEEGQATMWSFFAITELEQYALSILNNRIFLAPEKRDAQALAIALEGIVKPLHVLDQALARSGHLVADRFTVADLNVAAVTAWGRAAPEIFKPVPNVRAWLDDCVARPAYRTASRY